MKYLKEKDKKNRKMFKKKELNFLIYKSLTQVLAINSEIRSNFLANKLQYLGKKFSYVKVINRCILSNNSSSVYRKFRLYRVILRKESAFGHLIGIRKSSW